MNREKIDKAVSIVFHFNLFLIYLLIRSDIGLPKSVNEIWNNIWFLRIYSILFAVTLLIWPIYTSYKITRFAAKKLLFKEKHPVFALFNTKNLVILIIAVLIFESVLFLLK